MPYTIRTKDGIIINNVPDDIAPDSQQIKDRVAQLRSARDSTQQQPQTPDEQRDTAIRSGELPALDIDRERLGMTPRRARTSDDGAAREAKDLRRDIYNRLSAPIKMGLSGLAGSAEMGLTLGTGMAGQAVGGLEAIPSAVLGNTNYAEQVLENRSRSLTYMPRSEAAQSLAKGITTPIQKLDTVMRDGAEWLGAGNPELATIAYTAMNMLPVESQLGRAASAVKSNATARQMAQATESVLLEQGIHLGSRKMSEQIGQAVRNAATNVPRERGASIEDLAADVKQEAFFLGQAEDMMYSLARNTPAYITSRNLQGVQFAINDILKGFTPDIRESARIKYIQDQVQGMIGDGSINMNAQRSLTSLNELDQLRRQIKNGLPTPDKFTGADKAALQIKGQLDEFIDRQFEMGLIHGDDAAIEYWRQARAITEQYRKDFGPDSVLYRLATDHQANPEDFRKYIFGLSQSGAKTESAQVVQRIKEVFGENSPQVNALRMEFLMDALEPLRGDTPDLRRFVTYYDKVIRNNPTLIKELSPFAATGLDELARVARAAIKTGDATGITFSIPTMVARMTVGHQIARKGALVGASAKILDAVFGRSPRQVRREMLYELMGVNPVEPMFAPNTLELQGVWAAALNEAFTREFEEQQGE